HLHFVCPDKESECPDGTTCCQLPDSSWACCPLAKVMHTSNHRLHTNAKHFTPRNILHVPSVSSTKHEAVCGKKKHPLLDSGHQC
uniref:Granulins domain-containing protein n=1 Tax=Echeneis naucrates TaxID=173247 RepID=A0A665VJN4_ECHNA